MAARSPCRARRSLASYSLIFYVFPFFIFFGLFNFSIFFFFSFCIFILKFCLSFNFFRFSLNPRVGDGGADQPGAATAVGSCRALLGLGDDIKRE